MMGRCTYLLPIRRGAFSQSETVEFAGYFNALTNLGCDVLVIDGSPANVFDLHHAVWSQHASHEKVDPHFGYLNAKVNGIHTGVGLSPNEKIILADDDIRYNAEEIERISNLLDEFEVVRPQNYLHPLPWWARMEAARMLINRATLAAADYPGTCAFLRSAMLRVGHYDGDVLFDNEELIRHFARHKARICYANDFFVQKSAPRLRKWLEQRPRQAYEDFALRAKTALFFALPVCAIFSALLFGKKGITFFSVAAALAAMAVAFAGWRRGQARKCFPPSLILFAPLWILERSLSTYWALYWYLRHGGYPFGDRLLSKGIGRDWFEGGRIAARGRLQS
jgi:Glycosyl transferase family 21